MPALVFPSNPSDGADVFINGRNWTYDAGIPAWRPKADIAIPPDIGGTYVAHDVAQALGDTAKRRAQANIGLAKHNPLGITAPTAANDTTQGYSTLSLWADVTHDLAYVCVDATANAAVWRPLTADIQTIIDLIEESTAFGSITTSDETPGYFVRVASEGGLESVSTSTLREAAIPVLTGVDMPFAVNATISGTAANGAIVIGGAGNSTVNGIWIPTGNTFNGRPEYRRGLAANAVNYSTTTPLPVSSWPRMYFLSGAWKIARESGGDYYSSTSNAATPDLVGSWNVVIGPSPAPTVEAYVAGDEFTANTSVSGAFLSQLYRAGTDPYEWYRWNGTSWQATGGGE